MLIGEFLWVIMAYVAGSIPFGLVIAKTFCGVDPRLQGSKSIGATNISRLCGTQWGILTLACDLGKGALPVWGALLLGHNAFFVNLTGLACVTGHVYSCFLKFKGGKAVATSIGVFLPLAIWPLLGSCAICMLVIWRTGFVSLGSLTLLGSLPVFLAFCGMWEWMPLAICLCAIVFYRHRDNIRRLREGTENSWLKSKNTEGKNA